MGLLPGPQITWTTETRRLGDLREWDKNPRLLSKHDAEHIKRSLDTFGLADPLIINADGQLIGGHQRKHILADPETLVDVRVPSRQLTEREAEELAIRLNKAQGSWDWELLANNWEMDTLIEWGFSTEELHGLDFGDEPAEDPGAQVDKAEELREKYNTAQGQVWLLGKHVLVVGDCEKPETVKGMMGDRKASAVVTDPPYGISLDTDLSEIKTDWKGWKGQGGKYAPVAGDDKPYDPSLIFENFDCQEMFLWGADYYAERIPNRNDGSWLVWDKRVNEKSGADLSWGLGSEFELCWSKKRHKREVIRKLWSGLYGTETQDVRKRVHPTQKPLEVIEWILEKYTKEGEVIVDPYLGSGTTLIACERLERECRGAEIDPGYAAVIIQRWEDLTGLLAVCVSDQ